MGIAMIKGIKVRGASHRIRWKIKRLQVMRIAGIEIVIANSEEVGSALHVRLINAQTARICPVCAEIRIDYVANMHDHFRGGPPNLLCHLVLVERAGAAIAQHNEPDRAGHFQSAERGHFRSYNRLSALTAD